MAKKATIEVEFLDIEDLKNQWNYANYTSNGIKIIKLSEDNFDIMLVSEGETIVFMENRFGEANKIPSWIKMTEEEKENVSVDEKISESLFLKTLSLVVNKEESYKE